MGGALQPAADHPQRRGNGGGLRRKQQHDRFALAHGVAQGRKQLGGIRATDGVGKLRRKGGGFFFKILVGGIKGGLILRLAADGKNSDLHGTAFPSYVWTQLVKNSIPQSFFAAANRIRISCEFCRMENIFSAAGWPGRSPNRPAGGFCGLQPQRRLCRRGLRPCLPLVVICKFNSG